ncbi:hypothetical protein BJF78_13765 [Pseudonocardia sp. CNS-139]|nr:hypothetical protein BJF78_13765 [Pseudonocardia sp. CNS-139]
MGELDLRTIDRLATLICSHGERFERSVRELRRFLEGAGWTVDYPGGARIPWLVETIRAHNHDREAIEALLRRMIDPREYDGGLSDAQEFVDRLNPVLTTDGLEVGHRGARPFVRRLDDNNDVPLEDVAGRLADPALRDQVRNLVRNPAMAQILIARLDEVEASRRAGAYLLAVIGTGSFVEGLLHDILVSRTQTTRKEERAPLADLLARAHALGWIQHDALKFNGYVREYRNFVHPRQQLESGLFPDNDTVLLCWQPVLAIINDLRELLPQT